MINKETQGIEEAGESRQGGQNELVATGTGRGRREGRRRKSIAGILS